MMNLQDIAKKLKELKFPETVLDLYREQHRHYHTTAHLLQVIEGIEKSGKMNEDLFLAAVYHDAVYDPRSSKNEEDSVALFKTHAAKAGLKEANQAIIEKLIMETKSHLATSDLSQVLIDADLAILHAPFDKLMEYEHQIFREFQFVDYKIYKQKRLEVLHKFNTRGQLNSLIEYVNARKPMIGVFCGSFNPFHKGHYNVLQKAEKIFDKVIIAFGKNPDKTVRTWPVPSVIKYHQMEEYNGLLTDFVASLSTDVVVVRGLRNSTDFQYEQNQYRYIQELMPGIRIINIFCDKEFEHISSSGIRTLEKFNKHQSYLLD